MNRYKIETFGHFDGYDTDLAISDDGEWVKYEDVKSLIKQLEKRRLTNEYKRRMRNSLRTAQPNTHRKSNNGGDGA
jgi:hypothetical protein